MKLRVDVLDPFVFRFTSRVDTSTPTFSDAFFDVAEFN